MADWKSSQEFLKEFYASPIVNEDTISAKIKRIFVPKSRKASALKELAGDLSGEGRAGDVTGKSRRISEKQRNAGSCDPAGRFYGDRRGGSSGPGCGTGDDRKDHVVSSG